MILDIAMKVGLYFQQDSIWYVAMHIQPSAGLRDGSWEAHTGDSGCKMPDHNAGVKYYTVNLNWQPCCLGLTSTALRFCPTPLFFISPTNEMSSSCWTHESAVWLSHSQTPAAGRGLPHLLLLSFVCGCLIFVTNSDQIWGNYCDCLKNPESRNNKCHLNDATMPLILRGGAF